VKKSPPSTPKQLHFKEIYFTICELFSGKVIDVMQSEKNLVV
jgi:hypothetical protein